MQECSLKDVCADRVYTGGCKLCDVAQALAEAEKQPATYVTAKLTDEQFDRLLKNNSLKFVKSYHLFPNNASIWFWIAFAVISVFAIIYR